jgi:hypothetical protein
VCGCPWRPGPPQIAVHRENDPAVLGELEAKLAVVKTAADRWTGACILGRMVDKALEMYPLHCSAYVLRVPVPFSVTFICHAKPSCCCYPDNIWTIKSFAVKNFGVAASEIDAQVRGLRDVVCLPACLPCSDFGLLTGLRGRGVTLCMCQPQLEIDDTFDYVM